MNKFDELLKNLMAFLSEVKIEMKNITWPTKEETIGATWVVLVAVFIISIFVGLIDFALQQLVKLVL